MLKKLAYAAVCLTDIIISYYYKRITFDTNFFKSVFKLEINLFDSVTFNVLSDTVLGVKKVVFCRKQNTTLFYLIKGSNAELKVSLINRGYYTSDGILASSFFSTANFPFFNKKNGRMITVPKAKPNIKETLWQTVVHPKLTT